MNKYDVLLNILDKIRSESVSTPRASTYLPNHDNLEAINQARSRAYIHLFLKVRFGLVDFTEREHFVTDGSNDGGVDGYFISPDTRSIYFIQSKFRTTVRNFSEKQMTLEELLNMDLNRILDGHEEDEQGNRYNGKILQLQREVRSIEDIARYKYRIIILANLTGPSQSKLSRLVGGHPCEVINHEESFQQLVFPVISGTYFNASDLVIHLDLSNKNAGSKISYTVDTRYGECDITVLFVPTIEIAKTFHKYKNSILKFNPRSYLELEGAKVNTAIKNTILQAGKNEFALYNNGITMLSDETDLNERIGQRNKAQLNIKNPQISNGGQTAYTLSRIWEESDPAAVSSLFEGKEVLLKVITLHSRPGTSDASKLSLIDSISIATNAQTVVIGADRYANERIHVELQRVLFERFDLLYERKRGEFADGIHKGYIDRSSIIERNLLLRIFLASNGQINLSSERKAFVKFTESWTATPAEEEIKRFYFGYLCYRLLEDGRSATFPKRSRDISGKVYAMTAMFMPPEPDKFESAAREKFDVFRTEWQLFLDSAAQIRPQYKRQKLDKSTMTYLPSFDFNKWFGSGVFETDVKAYFGQRALALTPRTPAN